MYSTPIGPGAFTPIGNLIALVLTFVIYYSLDRPKWYVILPIFIITQLLIQFFLVATFSSEVF